MFTLSVKIKKNINQALFLGIILNLNIIHLIIKNK
jgi:hypothetical protein